MSEPMAQRWIHPEKRRWYMILLHRDLFGDLVLIRTWGSLDSQRGGEKKEILEDAGDAEKRLKENRRLRLRHGYRPIQPSQAYS